MVCLHPGADTSSCARSMIHLLSSQHSECVSSALPTACWPHVSPATHCHCLSPSLSLSLSSRLPVPPQAAHVWRLRGSEGSFAKPSTCCSSWTSEEETPAWRKHCRRRAQVCSMMAAGFLYYAIKRFSVSAEIMM